MSRPEANEFTISQLSREFGLTPRTLRFYGDNGLLKPRRDGTRRFYSAACRERLARIVELTGFGFTLLEVARLLDLTDREMEPHLSRRLEEMRAELHDLTAAEQNLSERVVGIQDQWAA